MEIGATTRLIALLGDPVDHSFSPTFQNAAIRGAGLDAVYLALRCDADRFPDLLRALVAAGGAGNVTVPHKRRAAELVEDATGAVRRTGACNTFWPEGGRVLGHNTDVAGFSAAARVLIGSPAGARVLVLGAGGAARAAVAALLDDRADAIHLLNRTVASAESLRKDLDPRGRRVAVVPDASGIRREGYDLVVNATPLGLQRDDAAPLAFNAVSRIGAVLDLVYRPGGTAWVREARQRGIDASDGSEMLLRQGAESFRCWFGREPPLETMRHALDSAAVHRSG